MREGLGKYCKEAMEFWVRKLVEEPKIRHGPDKPVDISTAKFNLSNVGVIVSLTTGNRHCNALPQFTIQAPSWLLYSQGFKQFFLVGFT